MDREEVLEELAKKRLEIVQLQNLLKKLPKTQRHTADARALVKKMKGQPFTVSDLRGLKSKRVAELSLSLQGMAAKGELVKLRPGKSGARAKQDQTLYQEASAANG